MARGKDQAVPSRALLISLFCLLAPVVLLTAAPDLLGEDAGALVWLLALVPAFLLSYYRGWKGASLALAAGMAAISVTHGVLLARGLPPLSPTVMLWTTSALVVVGFGAGSTSTLLLRSRVEAERQALRDPGTGLPNRRRALLHLERGFAAARRGTRLVVILFDLDHFKRVNDQHGHAVGDDVLLEFARVLSSRTREMNLSARIGGEEFLSILEDCDVDAAVRFAEDIREAFQDATSEWGGLTASAGVAAYEPGMASPDVLMAAADQALYASKQHGRDRISVAGRAREGGTDVALTDLSTDEEMPGRGERILVVDDDEAARQSVAKALRRFGYEVLETGGAERAVQIARGLDGPPDLLITDVIMPSMSGFRLAEVLAESIAELRVLYMSGYVGDETGWRGAPGTVRGFLQKPVALEDLSRAVRRLLDQPVSPVLGDHEPTEGDRELDAREAAMRGQARPDRARAAEGPGERRPALVTAEDGRSLGRAEIRLRHLGQDPVMTRSFDELTDLPEPRLVVLWMNPPYDRELDVLPQLRSRWDPPPPLLLVAPELPAEIQSVWSSLFPAVFLPASAGLGEWGLHVDHLQRLGSLSERQAEERTSMSARVQARTAELESAHRDLLLRLGRAGELRDDLTGRHAERVGYLATQLARELALPKEEVEIVGQTAPVHDLGKIAIPDAILNKPAALTTTERQMMESHTEVGAQLLSGSRHPMIQEAERIARFHHEWWDGTGYPRGLAGEEIPLSARIVAVADVFDTITHRRPYREASTAGRALAMIVEDRESHFDPEVVDALRNLNRRGDLQVDPEEAVVASPDASPVSPLEIRELLRDFVDPEP